VYASSSSSAHCGPQEGRAASAERRSRLRQAKLEEPLGSGALRPLLSAPAALPDLYFGLPVTL
jgi:hypothetical protein